MSLVKKLQELKLEMTRWRHRLHAEPELAFEERATSRLIARQLRAFGIDELRPMAGTGIVGVLHGRGGAAADAPAIMLRADMDALPITEDSTLPHASRNKGVHHACGHDGHVAMLLGAAKHLAATRHFDGTVYFVFQPAEESRGGAKRMMEEGLFENFPADAIFGLHNFPGLPLGTMATAKGPVLAASEEYRVVFKGNGGHDARPGAVIDVVAAGAEAALALRALAAAFPAGEQSVLSVCGMKTSGIATNALADRLEFNGTIRTFDAARHEEIKAQMQAAVAAVAEKYGAGVEVVFENPYPVLVNPDAETDFAIDAARDIVGADNVVTNAPPTLGSEDFAWYLQVKRGNFMALGTGPADGGKAPDLHSPRYDFNDAALPLGAAYWVRLVEKALPVADTPDAPDADDALKASGASDTPDAAAKEKPARGFKLPWRKK